MRGPFRWALAEQLRHEGFYESMGLINKIANDYKVPPIKRCSKAILIFRQAANRADAKRRPRGQQKSIFDQALVHPQSSLPKPRA